MNVEVSINNFVLAFAGGLLGTVFMDAIKYVGCELRLIGGVRMDMLGRWALGMVGGKFIHEDIHDSPSMPNEIPVGWSFHYLTGGLVALGYPILLAILSISVGTQHMVAAIAFGLGTSILPWFVVYPSFGKGWFGSKAPKSARPILTSLVSHAFYGAGIGVVFLIGDL